MNDLLNEALNRICDLLANDDGQAHKEARKFLERVEASQAQQQTNQEPLLTLILGGIEGDEYAENDVEWHTKAVDALQEKLVRGSDAVFVPLYMQSQAQQDHIGDANKMVKTAHVCAFSRSVLDGDTETCSCGAWR